MKILILLSIAGLLLTIPLKSIGNSKQIVDGPTLGLYIEWGTRPDCVGDEGFCKFRLIITESPLPTPTVSLDEGSNAAGGFWTLTLPKEVLASTNPVFLAQLEGKTTVSFPETFVAPKEFSTALGINKDLIIKGNTIYPVRYENGVFKIKFPL